MAKSSLTYSGKIKPYGKPGHFYESLRHSLQAKGIKTGNMIPKGKIGYDPKLLKEIKKANETYARTTMPLLSYAGGKTKLTKKLLKKMPPHKTYVEPFVGGASVFLRKPPAEKSVINDKDKEVMDFYKAFSDIDVEAFNNLDFKPSKKKFEKLKDKKPKNNLEKVEKTLYLNKNSFMGNRESYAPKVKSDKLNVQKKAEHYKKRLKDPIKLNTDFEKVIEKYDSPDTFFYLDPPYHECEVEYEHHDVTPKDVYKAVKDIKGKFMLSYNVHPDVKETFKNYNIDTVTTAYPYKSGGGHGAKKKELLITNYDTK